MAFSARQQTRHWPLTLFLISFMALTGCRGDSNTSGLFPGGSPESSSSSSSSSSSDSGSEQSRPSPGSQQQPGRPLAGHQANDQVKAGSPGRDISGTPQRPAKDNSTGRTDRPAAGGNPVSVKRPSLQWDSPLTREDGSKLYPGEISGYRVYFRFRHQKNFRTITLDGPDANRLRLDNFASGAYEFAVSTLDSAGLESRRSAPVPVDLI